MQILIIEDEWKISQSLKKGLTEENYAVDIATDGQEGLYKFSINEYDLIILDLMIPKVDGFRVCQEIRKKNTDLPILILSAKDDVEDRVKGLDYGADDYITKPFSFTELTARIRALLRRGNKADPVILQVDDLTFDPTTKIVKRGGRQISLTAREHALLEYFMRHKGMVLSRTQLLEHVWDYNYNGVSNVVDTYVKYLRKKLKVNKSSTELLHTVRGLGYILKD